MGPLILAVPGWLFLVVAIGLVLGALAALFYKDYRWVSIVCAIPALVFGGAWIYTSTHVVIPVNQVAVVVDTTIQKVDGDLRPSGIIDVPLVGAHVLLFPSQVAYKPCDNNEQPAAQGGTALTMNICYTSDASKIDWKAEFLRQGRDNEGEMFAVWHYDRSQAISAVMGSITTGDLTTRIDWVGQQLFAKLKPVFDKEGVPLNAVVVQFWDFVNKSAGQQLDEKTASARADIEVAKLEQQAALTRVQTQNQVLAQQAQGLQGVFDTLGIVDSRSRGELLQTEMLIQFLTSHPNTTVIMSTGASSADPAMLAQPKIGATPAPTQQSNGAAQ